MNKFLRFNLSVQSLTLELTQLKLNNRLILSSILELKELKDSKNEKSDGNDWP